MDRSDPGRRIELLEGLLEELPHALWIASGEWTELVFVNAAFENVWGRPIETLREDPESIVEGVHPEDRVAVGDALDRLAAGEAVDLACRVDPGAEFERWVNLRGTPVRDGDGTVGRIRCMATDITERKTLEADREHYRTVLRNVPDGVYLYDTDADLTFVNRAAVERSPLSREQLLGASVRELLEEGLIDEDRVDEIAAHYEQLAAGDREEVRETLRLETVDGPRPFAVRSARGETESGEFVGVVSVVRDITDRMEAEEELRRKNERLEEFAGVLSHDLRNPLNVATGRLELAREECESDHLDEIAAAHDRMTALIDDLLTLARAGESATDTEPVALADSIEGCWGNVATERATLVVDTERTIAADRGRLQQLLENLVRNAIDHGGEDVTVRVGDLEDGFYVADDGPGIPADERDAVFELGYSNAAEGTGFGLGIVKQVADAHDWSVRATESRDGGARVEITGVEPAR